MSIRQSRTVRWFGTRVPLLSRGALVILTLCVALVLSGFLFLYYGYTVWTIFGWLEPLLITLVTGTIGYISYLLYLLTRYRNASSNPDFDELVGRVLQRILVPSNAQVWVRPSPDAYIVSTFNPVFNAVIVSEPMVNLMLARPEAGEVLLAFHLARIPRRQWLGDYVGSIILFVLLTFLSHLTVIPAIYYLITSWSTYGIIIVYSFASLFGYLIIFPLAFVVLVKGSFWRHEPAFVRVLEVYGMHPQVAKVEVERGFALNDEEAQAVIWGVREWERKKRYSRRSGIGLMVGLASGVLIYILELMLIGYIVSIPFFYFAGYLPFIGGFVVGGVVYFILRRWDKNAMGEVFHETSDSHEPLWMD